MVSRNSLIQFKQIYKQEYGIDLPDDEAYELASNLSNLYRSVYLISKNKNISQDYEKELQYSQAKS